MTMQSKMAGIPLSPMEEVGVIMANTDGEAFRVVENLQAACGGDTVAAVAFIWKELRQQYGSPVQIAATLFKWLDSFPAIKDGIKWA